jgi:hypothetical protein
MALIAILVSAYVFSYAMVIVPSPRPRLGIEGPWATAFFKPVHWVDVRLRPSYWNPPPFASDLDRPFAKTGSSD